MLSHAPIRLSAVDLSVENYRERLAAQVIEELVESVVLMA